MFVVVFSSFFLGCSSFCGSKRGRNDLGVKSNLLAAILCCNTTLSKEKGEDGVMKWTPKGNSSEAPIVVAARKVGLSENIANDYPRVLEVPFSSSRKMMLTVSKVGGSHLCQGGMPLPPGTNYLTVCKGAPNYIIVARRLCCLCWWMLCVLHHSKMRFTHHRTHGCILSQFLVHSRVWKIAWWSKAFTSVERKGLVLRADECRREHHQVD